MKSNNPLVSIIIPAFNAEQFISECVNSVLNQTYKNIEIIVVNDGSADRTNDILEKINDPRLFVLNQENKGCSASKNFGLSYAKGDYIQYLDADDLLSKDKIELQINAIQHNFLALAVCKTVVFQDSVNCDTGDEIDTKYLYSTKKPFDFILNLYGFSGKGAMIQPNAFLMHKYLAQKIGKWDTTLSPSPDEDGEYFCRAMLFCTEIVYTYGTNYYRKINTISSLSKKCSLSYALGALRSEKLKANHLLKIDSSEPIKRLIAKHYAFIAYLYGVNYPEIINLVKEDLLSIGVKKIPIVGGSYFKFLAYIIGFPNAINLKRSYLNLFPIKK